MRNYQIKKSSFTYKRLVALIISRNKYSKKKFAELSCSEPAFDMALSVVFSALELMH